MATVVGRRLLVVSGERFGEILLGPASRQIELAMGGVRAGVETILVGRSCTRELPPGIAFRPLDSFRLDQVGRDDALIVNAYMSGRWLLGLLRSRLPFHADLYCLTATEILPGLDDLPWWTAWHLRWRRVLRYASLCARAETVYASNTHQAALLGGMIFSLPGRKAQRLAFSLPSKVVVAPMAPPAVPFPSGSRNPYPSLLAGRPVFLWGGGIWKWFDIETAMAAFGILRDRGSPAALFFLAGRNPSGHADQDGPHRQALESARSRGLLERNVFFNGASVGPAELPAYLEHCHAGVLSNGAHLESLASWRTRQLDLLWAGKPAVVAGDDPLSTRMAETGAGWIAPAGDGVALADRIEESLDTHAWKRSCEASLRLGRAMSEDAAQSRVAAALLDPSSFRDGGDRVDPLWPLRYLAGF